MSREPDWQRLPAELPHQLGALLRRCLQKDPRQRLQDLGDARWWLAESRELASGRSEPLPVPSRRSRGWVAGIAAAALVVGTAAGWLFATRAGVPRSSVGGSAATVAHFEVAPPETSTVATPLGRAVAVHPGGASFVFDAGDSLHRYELAEGASYAIAGTAGGAQAFFSDDGEWLGLFGGGGLAKMRPGGGPTEELCATSGLPAGASWHGDRIVFGVWDGPDRGLWWIRSSGGTRERLGDDPALAVGTHPSFLEGGRAIVFAAPGDEGDLATQELRVFDLSTGVVHDLGVKGRAPQYLSSGHLLWVQDEAVWAAAFDVDHSRLVGGPRQVLGLESTSLPVAAFAVSPNGTLVTVNHERFDLVEIAPDGSRRRLAAAEGQLGQPRLSRDGRFVAYMRGGVGLEKLAADPRHQVPRGGELLAGPDFLDHEGLGVVCLLAELLQPRHQPRRGGIVDPGSYEVEVEDLLRAAVRSRLETFGVEPGADRVEDGKVNACQRDGVEPRIEQGVRGSELLLRERDLLTRGGAAALPVTARCLRARCP